MTRVDGVGLARWTSCTLGTTVSVVDEIGTHMHTWNVQVQWVRICSVLQLSRFGMSCFHFEMVDMNVNSFVINHH